MSQTIAGYLLSLLGAVLLIWRGIKLLSGTHRPWKWVGGFDMSVPGELGFSTFILFGGLILLTSNPTCAAFALIAWLVGFLGERRDRRRHNLQEESLRATNALKHPGIFDRDPHGDLDSTSAEEFGLFDAGACTYLGRVNRTDLQILIQKFTIPPDRGPNDIYLLFEDLELLDDTRINGKCIDMLRHAFDSRDYLILRWMPPANSRSV